MNLLQARGNWNIVMGKLKQKIAQLTDDDIQFTKGKQEELVGRIQKRSGEADLKHPGNDCCHGCGH